MGYFDDPAKDKTPVIIGGGALAVLALTWCVCGFFWGREASVSGQVRMDEKPLAGANVTFIGTEEHNSKAPYTAMTDDNGRFELHGQMGPGIPRGTYKVVVTKLVNAADGASLSDEERTAARFAPSEGDDGKDPGAAKGKAKAKMKVQIPPPPPVPKLANSVPQAYEDVATTPLQFQIGGGSNSIQVEIKRGS